MLKKINLAVVFTIFAFFSIAQTHKWDKCRGKDIPGAEIYKHYSGTIGDKKVVLDLTFGFCGGSNYGGSTYYYPGKEGSTLFNIGEPDSFDLNITLYGEEEPVKNKLWENINSWTDRSKLSRWTFKIKDEKLTGTWGSADNKETRDINLTEDYTKSVPMELIRFEDKLSGTSLLYSKPSLTAKPADAEFVTEQQLNFLGATKEHNRNWQDFLRTLKESNSLGYIMFIPVYNDNGFLVFEKMTTPNDGKYKPKYSYLCLDVQNKKRLTLNDIIHSNNEITTMLETALRKKYNLDKDKRLNMYFNFEKVPVTNNIMLTEQGINFCYNFDEIVIKQNNLRPSESQIKVFLSYNQLKKVLQEDFKKRLKNG